VTKWLIVSVILLFNLIGCSKDSVERDKPPNLTIQIGNKTYKTKLGSYCWNTKSKGICVDTAGPVDLLKGEKPIQVKAAEIVTIKMDYRPKPSEVHVTQVNGNKEIQVDVKKNQQFKAPTGKGIYYYAYGVWWGFKNDDHISNGDVFYAFALEVK